jgi:hypothetical protein
LPTRLQAHMYTTEIHCACMLMHKKELHAHPVETLILENLK